MLGSSLEYVEKVIVDDKEMSVTSLTVVKYPHTLPSPSSEVNSDTHLTCTLVLTELTYFLLHQLHYTLHSFCSCSVHLRLFLLLSGSLV